MSKRSKFCDLNSYWLYGKHPVLNALKNPKRRVESILAAPRYEKFLDESEARFKCDKIKILTNEKIEKITKLEECVHQGLVIKTAPLAQISFKELLRKLQTKKRSVIVMLDQVLDPHNVGAIVRTAAAFGVDGVINTKDHAAKESAALIKSAAGAYEWIPYINASNLSNAISEAGKSGYWSLGLTEKADAAIDDLRSKYEKVCLVLGSEGAGLRRLTVSTCDLLVKINTNPSWPTLNVSNAAAIAIHMFCR